MAKHKEVGEPATLAFKVGDKVPRSRPFSIFSRGTSGMNCMLGGVGWAKQERVATDCRSSSPDGMMRRLAGRSDRRIRRRRRW